MTKKMMMTVGIALFIAGFSTGLAAVKLRWVVDGPHVKVVLDNQRVTISEIKMDAGSRRESYTRPTDQIIVFLDDADYEATDESGQKQVKHRRSGEIVWHQKGEAAPLLQNTGKRPYRNLVIALK